jgi:hypothetical protein
MKKELFGIILSCALLLTFISPSALAAQDASLKLTKAEESEAREVAAAFSDRLAGTRDFASVVREMYAEGFMARYLKRAARWAAGSSEAGPKADSFMLEGVPALDFKSGLAADADDENWPRLYAAANDVMRFGFLMYLSKKSLKELDESEDFDESALFDVYPPEALRVLDANPALANFLKRKGRGVEVETPEDLRSVTLAMEEAARLTRASLDKRLSSSALLEENMSMLKSAQAKMGVTLVEDEEALGYTKGTRLFRVFASAGYDLLLVKEGGKMKVAWATFPHD